MTRDDIQCVIDREPTLTRLGFDLGDEATQEALLDSAVMCTRICIWLADVETISRVNPKAGSYGKFVEETGLSSLGA